MYISCSRSPLAIEAPAPMFESGRCRNTLMLEDSAVVPERLRSTPIFLPISSAASSAVPCVPTLKISFVQAFPITIS